MIKYLIENNKEELFESFNTYNFSSSNNTKDFYKLTKNPNNALHFTNESEALVFINILNDNTLKITEHMFINYEPKT